MICTILHSIRRLPIHTVIGHARGKSKTVSANSRLFLSTNSLKGENEGQSSNRNQPQVASCMNCHSDVAALAKVQLPNSQRRRMHSNLRRPGTIELLYHQNHPWLPTQVPREIPASVFPRFAFAATFSVEWGFHRRSLLAGKSKLELFKHFHTYHSLYWIVSWVHNVLPLQSMYVCQVGIAWVSIDMS